MRGRAGPTRLSARCRDMRIPGSWRPLWPALLLPAVLVALGVVFLAAPRLGAAIFGLPAPEGAARGWLPALGLRDLAFGGCALLLGGLGERRALGLLLVCLAVIPIGDIAILLAVVGMVPQLALHAGSFAACIGSAVWVLRGASPRTPPVREDGPAGGPPRMPGARHSPAGRKRVGRH